MEHRRKQQFKQIRNILTVLFSGVLFGCLIAFYFIYFYQFNGSYTAGNVILSPEVIHTLNFKDKNARTGNHAQFVFQNIEFLYKHPITHEWKQIEVPLEKYKKIYSLIHQDVSLNDSNLSMEEFFKQASRLTLFVKTESEAEWQKSVQIFQQIDFSFDEDFYRVEVHEDNNSQPWVYFKHPDIYRKILEVLDVK